MMMPQALHSVLPGRGFPAYSFKRVTYKALHPTAYSFVPFARASLRSLRFRRRVRYCVNRQVLLRVLGAKSRIEGLLRLQDTVGEMKQFSHRRSDDEHLAFALHGKPETEGFDQRIEP